MIAKAKWFSVRKFGGWGLTPSTWQGWLYIIVAILPFVLIKNQSFQIVWGIILLLDFLHVFFGLKKDERETLHEAIAERNAVWFIIFLLCVGAGYQAFTQNSVDPFILIALLGGALVKSLTNFYLRDK